MPCSGRNSPRGSSKHVARFRLFAVFFLAFCLRVFAVAAFQGLASPPKAEANPDQLDYETIAYNLSTGHGYAKVPGVPTAIRPPGTPLALLPPYVLFGRSYLAARLWIVLLSSLTCLAVGVLAKTALGPEAALPAALALAVYPGHLYYAMHFLSETPYALFLTLALASSCRSLLAARSHWWDVVAGASWGVAILTRVELLAVVPVAWILVSLAARPHRRACAARVLAQTLVVFLCLAPWVARNVVQMKSATLSTQRGFTFWGVHNQITLNDGKLAGGWVRHSLLVDDQHPLTGTEVEREAQAFSYGIEFVSGHLRSMPYLTVMKLWRVVDPFIDTPNRAVRVLLAAGWFVLVPFVVCGAMVMIKGRQWTAFATLASPLLALVVTTVVFYGSQRYRDALAPVFVTIATAAYLRLRERFSLSDIL